MAKGEPDALLREWAELLADIIREGFPIGVGRHVKGVSGSDVSAVGEFARRTSTIHRTASYRVQRMRSRGFSPIWESAIAEMEAKANERKPLKLRKVNAVAKRNRIILLTAAQDSTPLHKPFFDNLRAYAAARNAEIMIGGFTYQKGLFQDHSVKAGVYASEVVEHLRPVETRLSENVIWCGHANIVPTATNPLSGWQTHGGHSSIIIPHAKIALESVPVMPGSNPKIALSTGVCTYASYVKRNAGMKAEWHHTIGFSVVEIAANGAHWMRPISANEDGSFSDLDWHASKGKVTSGNRVEAITFGDIHHLKIDPIMSVMTWGIHPDGSKASDTSMVDVLNPRFGIHHDLIDFGPRNHHNRDDPIFRAMMLRDGTDSVQAEIAAAARWLAAASRKNCRTIVIDSNHNDALVKWLRSPDGRMDAANSHYWHSLNARWHKAVTDLDATFHPFEYALRQEMPKGSKFEFVRAGQSFIICPDAPIENGLHGHNGVSGARGSVASFARMAPRLNTAHSHTPAIREGVYVAGTNTLMQMGYNLGPGAWAHADIVTHSTGKRQIVIKNNIGWRL